MKKQRDRISMLTFAALGFAASLGLLFKSVRASHCTAEHEARHASYITRHVTGSKVRLHGLSATELNDAEGACL
jgi:hypothetical protein